MRFRVTPSQQRTSLLRFSASSTLMMSLPFAAALAQTPATTPYTFGNAQIVGGGFVTGIVSEPHDGNVRYARTDIGGTFRWEPTTKTWTPLNDFLNNSQFNYIGTEAIGLDPNDPNRLYLASGTYTESFEGNGAILVSEDRGATFTISPLPIKLGSNDAGRFAGERLVVDPNNGADVYFGSRLNGLWMSKDHGATWAADTNFPVTGPTGTSADPGVGVIFGYFDKASGTALNGATRVGYFGVSDPTVGLYVTKDGGVTFAPVTGQPTGFYPNSLATDKHGNLYISYGQSKYGNSVGPYSMTSGAIWKYTTASGTWTNITPPNPNHESYGFGSVAVDPSNANNILVSTMDRYYPPPQDDIFRSTDGGQTWISLQTNSNRDVSKAPWVTFGAAKAGAGNWINHLWINPDQTNQVLYGNGQTIWATDKISSGDTVPLSATSIAVGGATDWYIDAVGLEETAVLALISPPKGPAHLISGLGDIGGFTHTNLDRSPKDGADSNPIFGNTTGLDFAANQPETMVRVGNTKPFGAYSRDGGLSWTPFATDPSTVTNGNGSVALSADGGTLLWLPADANSGVFYSNDYGQTWTASLGSPQMTAGQNQITVLSDRADAKTSYVYNPITGALLVSSNRGQSYRAASNLATYGTLYVSPAAKGDLWFTGNGQLSHSTDGGLSFFAVKGPGNVGGFGFGAKLHNNSYPTLFLYGSINGTPDGHSAFFRSTNKGATWVRINDDAHQYGNFTLLTGDPRVFGRVYIGTNGRGIIVADPR